MFFNIVMPPHIHGDCVLEYPVVKLKSQIRPDASSHTPLSQGKPCSTPLPFQGSSELIRDHGHVSTASVRLKLSLKVKKKLASGFSL